MTLLEHVRACASMPPPALARAIRLAAGVSQAAMARELGVHRVTFARWEKGIVAPRGDARARYAGLLADIRRSLDGAA